MKQIEQAATSERHIVIDAEHFPVRFWGPVLALGLVVLAHIVGMALAKRALGSSVSPLCVVLPADLLIFIAGGMIIERLLRRVWPSRRSATLSEQALVITDARRSPARVTRIEWDRTVNVRAWRFPVQRRTRIPRGWYCMALHLLQDEEEAILYTFMPPQEAENAIGYRYFVRLRPRRETQSNTDLSAVAEQRRLLKLEDQRWNDGAEIAREDFHAVLHMLRQRVPDWR
jgi:hypothetical protein